jgi:transcriptional regulator with XRE-family HTH domain
MKKIAMQLKELRERAGLSQNELSKRAKVSAGFINKLEKGEYTTLSIDKSHQLALGLGMTFRDFLEAVGFLNSSTTPKADFTLMSALRARKLSNEQVNQVMSYISHVQQNGDK